MGSDKRYGPAPRQPHDAASLLDMIDGPITIVGEAELAELRRKAAAWDWLVARSVATIETADRDGALIRCELAGAATAAGDDSLSPYSVYQRRRNGK